MSGNTFIGIEIDNYKIKKLLGTGATGSVHLGERDDEIKDKKAFKFIKKTDLRDAWENEINKVTQLSTVDGIVPYVNNGDITQSGTEYKWISWKYIQGKSLSDLCSEKSLNVPLIISVLKTILATLHACKAVGIVHGDLHTGNVLIEDRDELNIIPGLRRVWVTDFGYLTASIPPDADMLDDYMGVINILKTCLASLKTSDLDGKNKKTYLKLKVDLIKCLSETDSTQGVWVRNPRELLKVLNGIENDFDMDEGRSTHSIGDYLAAETIGDRYEVWKDLFVPVFAGSEDLLTRNICVMTGLRGCGKTMVFRRLTALYNIHLGIAKVKNANSFIGLYLNARNIAEAFPWLPDKFEAIAREQVIHFFHVSWSLEIVAWLKIYSEKNSIEMTWLAHFYAKYFDDFTYTSDSNVLQQLESKLISELDRSRLSAEYGKGDWPLKRLDFLELVAIEISNNLRNECVDKMFYFFLDDYSMPLVSENIQRILNPIVFRRSALSVFKIATESIESILFTGLNDKSLEQDDDFILIDTGSYAMMQSETKNQEIISMILQPRIDLDETINFDNATLTTILGTNPMSNNSLAKELRGGAGISSNTIYWGKNFFVRLWSSNTREIIELFSRLVESGRQNPGDIAASDPFVRSGDQNTLFRDAGTRYLDLLTAAMNPSKEKLFLYGRTDETYGKRLRDIADSFHEIAKYELLHKDIKNQKNYAPKQARRLEITDSVQTLPADIAPIYKGLIRYGLLVRDIRGKSVRGRPNPRHYLRSILIPFYTLTFSKKDSISMNWSQFCDLLRNPNDFSKQWIKHQKQNLHKDNSLQSNILFEDEDPNNT